MFLFQGLRLSFMLQNNFEFISEAGRKIQPSTKVQSNTLKKSLNESDIKTGTEKEI